MITLWWHLRLYILHCLQRYNFGSHAYMAIKIDMSKAYDRVE